MIADGGEAESVGILHAEGEFEAILLLRMKVPVPMIML